jgi:hypothetical protein
MIVAHWVPPFSQPERGDRHTGGGDCRPDQPTMVLAYICQHRTTGASSPMPTSEVADEDERIARLSSISVPSHQFRKRFSIVVTSPIFDLRCKKTPHRIRHCHADF